jgi:Na+/melibiose symporter-like transporter
MMRGRSALLRGMLPPPGLLSYSAINLIDTIGTGMYFAISVVYFRRVLELTNSQIGFGLSLSLFISLAAPIPAGRVGDRFGHRRTLVVLTSAVGLAFMAFPLVSSYLEFLLLLSVVALIQAAMSPSRRAILTLLVGDRGRVTASAYIRAVSNVGFSLGAAAAAVAVAVGGTSGLRELLILNGVSYLAAALLTARLRLRPSEDDSGAGDRETVRTSAPYRDWSFLNMSVLNGLIATHESVLAVGLPLFVLSRHAPSAWVPTILVLNTILTVAFQVRASRGVEGLRGGRRALIRAALLLAVCAALLSLGSATSGVALSALILGAVLVVTVAELLSSAGGWSLSYAMSDGPRQGEYLGVFTTIEQGTAIGGPIAMAVVVDRGVLGWAVLGSCYALLAAAVLASTRARAAAGRTIESAPTS